MAETGKLSPASTASITARATTGVKRVSPWNTPLASEAASVGEHRCTCHDPSAPAMEAVVVGTSKRPRYECTMPRWQDHSPYSEQCFGVMNVLEKERSPSEAHVVPSGIVEVGDNTVSAQSHNNGDEIEMLLMPFPDMLLENQRAPTFLLRATGQVTASHLSAYLVTKRLSTDAVSWDLRCPRDAYRLHAATETGDILAIPGGMTMDEVADVFQQDGKQLELYYSRGLD
ncbi:hypothetical protein MTO96_024133 [Rhipicephalus appendiculatus]